MRIDDAIYDHPKWVGADPFELGVLVLCLAWSNRNQTDGRIPWELPARFGAGPAHVQSMMARQVLEEDDGQYHIHDYLDYQFSAEQIQGKARKERERWHRRTAGNAAGDSTAAPDGLHDDSAVTPRGVAPNSADTPRVSQYPIPKKKIRAATPRQTFDEDFEVWWVAWPKKLDKAEAKAKYNARRRAGVSSPDLVKARDCYLASVTDVRYCKHGATFLGPDTWREWLNGTPSNGHLIDDLTALSTRRLG